MKQLFCAIALVFIATIGFTGCDRLKKDDEATALQTVSTDASDMESVVQNAEMDADEEIEAFNANLECPEITFENPQGTFPNTVTLDYGTVGCEGPNGHIRKGKLVIFFSDSLINANAYRELTFVNFSVDDIQVEGTRTMTNTGLNAANQPTFSRTVLGASLTWPDDATASWTSNTVGTMTSGFGDNVVLNNVWSIEGTGSGVGRNGNAWTSSITEPIIRKQTCRWPVAGIRNLTVEENTLTLDYGYGSGLTGCDRKAELTKPNGQTTVVNVRF